MLLDYIIDFCDREYRDSIMIPEIKTDKTAKIS